MRQLDLSWLTGFFNDDTVSISGSKVLKVLNRADVSDYFWEVVVEYEERVIPTWCEESAGRFNLVETSPEGILRIPFAVRCHEKVPGINFEHSTEYAFGDVVRVVFWDKDFSLCVFIVNEVVEGGMFSFPR